MPSGADLPVEGRSFQRPDEVGVDLIGSEDDGGHGVLVLRRRRGEERQRGQRDVILTAGQAALVVAVRAQAAAGGSTRRKFKSTEIPTALPSQLQLHVARRCSEKTNKQV